MIDWIIYQNILDIAIGTNIPYHHERLQKLVVLKSGKYSILLMKIHVYLKLKGEKMICKMDLYKARPRHCCHLFVKQEPYVQEDLQIAHKLNFGKCNPVQSQRWQVIRTGEPQNPQAFLSDQGWAKVDSSAFRPLQSLGSLDSTKLNCM